ncbi:MAG: hypothetical protein JWR80_4855 [Bradyrhizobium sp.]|nr:hypothetical protein [Bradyrhizobium sp.]
MPDGVIGGHVFVSDERIRSTGGTNCAAQGRARPPIDRFFLIETKTCPP